MTPLELTHEVPYWVAVAALLGLVAALWLNRYRRLVPALALIGFAALTMAIVPRWIQTGHPPIFGAYENTIAAVWALVAVMLVLLKSRESDADKYLVKVLAVWIPPLLVGGWFFDRTPYPLTISERSLLVDIHVLFAWSAHTALLVASGAAISAIARASREDEAPHWDAIMFRAVGYGFAALTVMLAVGSIYSYLLFGDWYKWELVEAFAAASWVAYAIVLHSAMMFSWRGKRLAWAVLSILPLMLATFWVWSFYAGTYHHFEIPAIRAR